MAEGITSRLTQEGAWYFAGYALSRAASLAMVPLYTRWLTPEEMGSADYLLGLLGIAGVLACGEIGQGLARHYPEEANTARRRELASSALWFSVLGSSLFALLIAVASRLGALDFIGSTSALLIGSLLVSQCGSQVLHYQLRWSGRAATAMLASTAMSAASILSAVLFVGVLGFGIEGFLAAQLLGYLTLGLASWSAGREYFALRISRPSLAKLLGFSLPLVPSSVAVAGALYADRFLIEHFLSVRELGIYSIAVRFAAVIGLVLVPLRLALTPIIYRTYRQPEAAAELGALRRRVILISAPLVLSISAFSPEIYFLLVAPEYFSGHALIGLVMLGTVLSSLYMFSPGLDIASRTWTITGINLFALALNIGLNILLLPMLGTIAAGIALCAGGLAMCLSYEMLGRAHYRIPGGMPGMPVLILPTLAMTALLIGVPGIAQVAAAARLAILATMLAAMACWAIWGPGVGATRR